VKSIIQRRILAGDECVSNIPTFCGDVGNVHWNAEHFQIVGVGFITRFGSVIRSKGYFDNVGIT
jgi:hypothetical protein